MSKVFVKGMTHVADGPVGVPVLFGNTGMFATVLRPQVGEYDFTVDPEFPIDTPDSIAAFVEGPTPLLEAILSVTPLTFTVRFLDTAQMAADPVNFAVLIEGILQG